MEKITQKYIKELPIISLVYIFLEKIYEVQEYTEIVPDYKNVIVQIWEHKIWYQQLLKIRPKICSDELFYIIETLKKNFDKKKKVIKIDLNGNNLKIDDLIAKGFFIKDKKNLVCTYSDFYDTFFVSKDPVTITSGNVKKTKTKQKLKGKGKKKYYDAIENLDGNFEEYFVDIKDSDDSENSDDMENFYDSQYHEIIEDYENYVDLKDYVDLEDFDDSEDLEDFDDSENLEDFVEIKFDKKTITEILDYCVSIKYNLNSTETTILNDLIFQVIIISYFEYFSYKKNLIINNSILNFYEIKKSDRTFNLKDFKKIFLKILSE